MKRRFRIQSPFNLNVIQMFSKYIQVPENVMTYIFMRDWSQVYLNLTGPEWIACSMLFYRLDQNLMIFNLLHFISGWFGVCTLAIEQIFNWLCSSTCDGTVHNSIWAPDWMLYLLFLHPLTEPMTCSESWFFYYKKCKLSLLSFNFLL